MPRAGIGHCAPAVVVMSICEPGTTVPLSVHRVALNPELEPKHTAPLTHASPALGNVQRLVLLTVECALAVSRDSVSKVMAVNAVLVNDWVTVWRNWARGGFSAVSNCAMVRFVQAPATRWMMSSSAGA